MTGLSVRAIVAFNAALSQIQGKLSRFSREESGATAVEYALIVGLIAVAIIVALTLFGTSVKNLFNQAGCVIRGGAWDSTANTCSA